MYSSSWLKTDWNCSLGPDTLTVFFGNPLDGGGGNIRVLLMHLNQLVHQKLSKLVTVAPALQLRRVTPNASTAEPPLRFGSYGLGRERAVAIPVPTATWMWHDQRCSCYANVFTIMYIYCI